MLQPSLVLDPVFQILGSIFRKELHIQSACMFQVCFIALRTFLLSISELLYYVAHLMF